MSRKLTVRLAALRGAESLATFRPPDSGPGRRHELKGDLAGRFSIDLKRPCRLLSRPIEKAPAQHRSSEQKRRDSVTAIEETGIEGAHG